MNGYSAPTVTYLLLWRHKVAYVFAQRRSQPSLELTPMYQRTDISLSVLVLPRKGSKSISGFVIKLAGDFKN